MFKETIEYRKTEIKKARPINKIKVRIKMVGNNGETDWLSITDDEFDKIKTLLTHYKEG